MTDSSAGFVLALVVSEPVRVKTPVDEFHAPSIAEVSEKARTSSAD